MLPESFLSVLPLINFFKSAWVPSIFIQSLKHLPLFLSVWELWPARKMKRLTCKVFLAAHLSLPTDNPCRFHLEALPWPPLHITREGAFLQTERMEERQRPRQRGAVGGTSLPQGEKGFGKSQRSLCSLKTTGFQRDTHSCTRASVRARTHTHTHTQLKEWRRKGKSNWFLPQACMQN